MMENRPDYSREQLNHFSSKILGAAMEVHSKLGPGLLEKTYEACLLHELINRGLNVSSQIELPVIYDGVHIDLGYRVDLIVEGSILVELKSVEKVKPVHEAQILTYLRVSQFTLGLLINFNVLRLTDGIKRFVSDF